MLVLTLAKSDTALLTSRSENKYLQKVHLWTLKAVWLCSHVRFILHASHSVMMHTHNFINLSFKIITSKEHRAAAMKSETWHHTRFFRLCLENLLSSIQSCNKCHRFKVLVLQELFFCLFVLNSTPTWIQTDSTLFGSYFCLWYSALEGSPMQGNMMKYPLGCPSRSFLSHRGHPCGEYVMQCPTGHPNVYRNRTKCSLGCPSR